jgi:hypothetical protein
MSSDPVLIRVELAFRSTEDQSPEELGDRIREAVNMIVGRPALEEFRVRTLPLKQRKGPRPVD